MCIEEITVIQKSDKKTIILDDSVEIIIKTLPTIGINCSP